MSPFFGTPFEYINIGTRGYKVIKMRAKCYINVD